MPLVEMKGPIRGVLWIHNAILAETQTFQDAVRSLQSTQPIDPGLPEQFKFFRRVLEFHETSEDEQVFPILDEKYPHVSATYDFDHQRQQTSYAEVQATLEALTTAADGARPAMLDRLVSQATAFAATMELHVAKENELLYPLYDRTFSVEEQEALQTKGMQEHPPPPDLMPLVGPWMFRLQPRDDDRADLARFFLSMFPPQQRTGLIQMLSGAVSPSEWSEVVRRVPELAG